MNKWIPILTPFTKYEDFIRSGSETDYEIGCHLTLFQTCEAMLKISINPNLQVTLQIGIIDESPEAA